MTIRALVPLKKLTSAKSRLAGAVAPEMRRRLVLHMAAHVIGVLRRTVDEIIMLAEDPVEEFAGLAQIRDVEAGLNANIMRAVRLLPHAPGDLMIVIFPDLPLLAPADVTALIEACAEGIAIATDHHGSGTNAIAMAAPEHFQFCFGADSRTLHAAEAARRGVPAVVLVRDGLAYDVDDVHSLHRCLPEFQALAGAGA